MFVGIGRSSLVSTNQRIFRPVNSKIVLFGTTRDVYTVIKQSNIYGCYDSVHPAFLSKKHLVFST